ncbi:hypothetical protein C8R46DRAFT_1139034 [Mycena filopes]|nr:hypothetical protein C8R46DRAFT_1139034 [Mycena filopes]
MGLSGAGDVDYYMYRRPPSTFLGTSSRNFGPPAGTWRLVVHGLVFTRRRLSARSCAAQRRQHCAAPTWTYFFAAQDVKTPLLDPLRRRAAPPAPLSIYIDAPRVGLWFFKLFGRRQACSRSRGMARNLQDSQRRRAAPTTPLSIRIDVPRAGFRFSRQGFETFWPPAGTRRFFAHGSSPRLRQHRILYVSTSRERRFPPLF